MSPTQALGDAIADNDPWDVAWRDWTTALGWGLLMACAIRWSERRGLPYSWAAAIVRTWIARACGAL